MKIYIMRKFRTAIAIVSALTLTGYVLTLSGCDDGPSTPRLYSEADSIALCEIMAEAPEYYEYVYKWDPKKIHTLPKGWKISWDMAEDGKLHITEFSASFSPTIYYTDCRIKGRVSESFNKLTHLRSFAIDGKSWEGEMPADFGSDMKLQKFSVTNTSLVSLACKMMMRDIELFTVEKNPDLVALPDSITTLSQNVKKLISVRICSNKSLVGEIPYITPCFLIGHMVWIMNNGYTTVNEDKLGFDYVPYQLTGNKISMTLSDKILNDPARLVKAYFQLIPQDGTTIINMPSEKEIRRIQQSLQ